jgi:ferredoxin-type protein NapG
VIGTPYFDARTIPCYMCVDIPCVPVCPTGALDVTTLTTKDEETQEDKLDINKAKMGVAVVDPDNCVAFWGIQCDACYRACPLMDEAISLVYEKNERTGKHAFLKPEVHREVCTGCGLCEHACITEEPSIIVLPHEIVTGKVGDHYIKGWDKNDEARLKNEEKLKNKEDEMKSTLDYLNSTDDLFDEE